MAGNPIPQISAREDQMRVDVVDDRPHPLRRVQTQIPVPGAPFGRAPEQRDLVVGHSGVGIDECGVGNFR